MTKGLDAGKKKNFGINTLGDLITSGVYYSILEEEKRGKHISVQLIHQRCR